MLGLNLEQVSRELDQVDRLHVVGKLKFVDDRLACALPLAVGDQCELHGHDDSSLLAEVIGFTQGLPFLAPYERMESIHAGMNVVRLGRKRLVPVGPGTLGRVLDGLGRPVDAAGPLQEYVEVPAIQEPPPAMQRMRVDTPFVTGQKAIDGLLTCGRGQRIGIFAGSGVGKSTLLGQVARTAEANLNVVCLVGERGCELVPFVEDCLGQDGLARSIVFISTCDQLPLMRIRAVESAITVADYYRSQGANVMFFLDSLTRLAMAKRELGLSIGEPPSSRGYTPSCFQLMAQTLECLGNSDRGSVTGFLTVLVDGGDLDEPVSDAARALLDGHIVLTRKLAESGHYPAIDISQSVSRAFLNITSPEHREAARRLRSIMSMYSDVEDLLRIGAYTRGTNAETDRAVELIGPLRTFLQQDVGTRITFEETTAAMAQIAGMWPY